MVVVVVAVVVDGKVATVLPSVKEIQVGLPEVLA
jgi:hypothetical protein